MWWQKVYGRDFAGVKSAVTDFWPRQYKQVFKNDKSLRFNSQEASSMSSEKREFVRKLMFLSFLHHLLSLE